MGIAFLVQAVLIVVTLPVMLYAGFGAFQWLIQLPLFVMFWRRGQKQTGKGILIMGFIGVLLNAACGLLVVWKMSSH
jgi:hypothetical protein